MVVLKPGEKPTCKAVMITGQRGVRIAPKGCKVRTQVTGVGAAQVKVKTNKAGKVKTKLKVNQRSFEFKI